MPTTGEKVIIAYETQLEYDSLQTKNSNCIYFTTDTGRIFVGDREYTHLMQFGQGTPSSQTATTFPAGTLYYDLTNKVLYYNYSGEWILLASTYHVDVENMAPTDLNTVLGTIGKTKNYFFSYSGAYNCSNRPETVSDSFILTVERQDGYRVEIYMQTYKNSDGDVYQRKIVYSYPSGYTYFNWEKIYPVPEATTSSAGLLSSTDKAKIDNLDSTYLRQDDVIVLTQAQYDALETKTGFLYLIKEE